MAAVLRGSRRRRERGGVPWRAAATGAGDVRTVAGVAPMTAFDLGGPLPLGQTVVLQASAGTGKTHAVATLAARAIAEGVVSLDPVSYTHLRAHETDSYLVCR